MYRKIFALKTFFVVTILVLTSLISGCGFYKADTVFSFDVLPKNTMEETSGYYWSGQLYAIFTEQTMVTVEHKSVESREYRFLTEPEQGEFILHIPVNAADPLPLQSGTKYFIAYTIGYYGHNKGSLYIFDGYTLIFAGVTDWTTDGYFADYEQYLPFTAKQTALLTNHRQGKSECVDSKTNTEITFTSKSGEKLTMHQGQSGKLGNYKIHLQIAQDVEFSHSCQDYFENQFSYTITKNS